MRIDLTSVFVDDQKAALAFYVDVLGFRKRHDVPLGEHRWLTVASPEQADGPELLLEPSAHPAVGPYRDALRADGIPAVQFTVDDVAAEVDRLAALGVEVVQPPVDAGEVVIAMVDDSCGNLVQLVSPSPPPA